MQLKNQWFNRWIKIFEIVVTVIWLLYFIGVNTPPPVSKLMQALSYPIIAILVILNWRRLSWVATRDIPLLLLIATALASVFWSVNIGVTLDGGRGLLRTVLFGAYFTTRYSLKEQMKILAWVFGIAAILSVVTSLAIPSYGTRASGVWQGIFPHKNILGYAMSIGAILFLIIATQEKRPNWLAWGGFGLTVAITFLAHSSSALLCILFLLSLMPVYKMVRQHYKLRVILFIMGCILAGSVAVLIVVNMETILVDILGEGLTYNGRTPIWGLIIEKTGERPWLGYGYNAFWKSDAGMYVILNTWASNNVENIRQSGFNAHSGYFELLPQLGFLGITLYAISFVTVFFRVFILLLSTKKIEYFWFFQFLVFMCISNIGDMFVSLLGSSKSYTAIYVSICLSTAVEWRRIRISQKRYKAANPSQLKISYSSKSKVSS